MTLLSVVVPLFNEERNVQELTQRLIKTIQPITQDYEVLIIDDGSVDKTWREVEAAGLLNKRIKGVKLSKNFGHHHAITAGLHKSKGDWVVVMDGDLQDRPEVIPNLMDKANKGFDVVFVSRLNRPESFGYKILQKIFYSILRYMSGINFDHRQANFSIISRKVVDAFKKFPENVRFYSSTILWLGFSRSFIEAEHGTRYAGTPSYTFKKRVNLAFDIILAFSERPLKFAIGLGFLMSVISFGFFSWVVVGYLNWGFSVIGWPSIMASIFLSSGSILVVLGIIGIYLGRVFSEVKSRPLYLIQDEINF
jgi:glycosyltransferase involved in cell wall biosynthesis